MLVNDYGPSKQRCGCNWRLVARWSKAIQGGVGRGRGRGSSAAFGAMEMVGIGRSSALLMVIKMRLSAQNRW
jgi:hypothetical protein